MAVSEGSGGKPRDLTRNVRLAAACAEYVAAVAVEKAATARVKALRTEILALVPSGLARAAGWLVRVVTVAATPDRTVTKEMVGQVLKGRAGSSRLEVTPAGGDALPAAA